MRWTAWARGRPRVSGDPPSANGASSFHLWWLLPEQGPFREVSAVLAVERPPSVARLYFWALQVSFVDQGRDLGAGHTGLQWHPGAPNGAITWGGYSAAGEELDGTRSPLPAVDGPNTSHFPWHKGRPYRFRISAAGRGLWRSDVTDLTTGTTTHVRELLVAATALANPVVWSEVFARCDDPPTEVRWSQLAAVDLEGRTVNATSVRLTYQTREEGGCANTAVRAGQGYFAQLTGLPGPRPTASEVLTLPS